MNDSNSPGWKPMLIVFVLLAGFIGIWLFWAIVAETVVFIFDRHWKIIAGVLVIYLVGLEVYELIYLRGKK